MKKIVVIDAHPNEDSLCFSLAESYMKGAKSKGHDVRKLRIAELDFNPNLRYGYQKRTDLEPDLLKALELIRWADHLVWIHPVWWSGLPAMAKGFIDRLFLPGLTYEAIPNSYRMKGLLIDKTAEIIATLDQPAWYYRWVSKAPSEHQLKQSLQLCGVKVRLVKYIGVVKTSTEAKRAKWLQEIERLGQKLK